MEFGIGSVAESGDTVEETAGTDDDAPAEDEDDDGDGNEDKPSRRHAPAAPGPSRLIGFK